MIAGKRSGSGKLVFDHYDTLKEIWGGSPSTEPLPVGLDSSSIESSVVNIIADNDGKYI